MINNLFPKWAKDELIKQVMLLEQLEKVKVNKLTDYTIGINDMIKLRKEIIEVIKKHINDQFPVLTPYIGNSH